MTISSDVSEFSYLLNGSTTTFQFNNNVFSEEDLEFYRTDADGVIHELTLNVDYTVSIQPDFSKATVTYPDAASYSTGTVTIGRNEPFSNLIDYSEGDRFPAETHERGLDRSVLRDQTLLRLYQNLQDYFLRRAITYPSTESIEEGDSTLPAKDSRKGTTLGFDAVGDLVAYPLPSGVLNNAEIAVEVANGQLLVDFGQSIAGVDVLVHGPLVDSATLLIGVDYTVACSTSISLTQSYPAGTLVVARYRDGNAPVFGVAQKAGKVNYTLASGQLVVDVGRTVTASDDIFISGPLADNGMLAYPADYTFSGSEVTLSSSYPAGTILIFTAYAGA